MEPIEVIDKLNSVKSAKDKEKVLESAWRADSYAFFKGLTTALDPFSKLSILKIPFITEDDDELDELGTKKLLFLYDNLRKHTLGEKETEQAIDNALNISSVYVWNNWYRRILLKDFRKTVTIAQVNRALTRISKKDARAMPYLIPTVSFQKHTDYKGEILVGLSYIDEFVKGNRISIILDKESNTSILFNDKGKEIDFDPRFIKILDKLPFGIMLDGVKTKNQIHITDMMPLEEYKKGYSYRDQQQRHEALCEIRDFVFSIFGQDVVIHPKVVINLNDTTAFEKIKEDFILQGIDTIMIKDIQQHYLTRKTRNWIKYTINKE